MTDINSVNEHITDSQFLAMSLAFFVFISYNLLQENNRLKKKIKELEEKL